MAFLVPKSVLLIARYAHFKFAKCHATGRQKQMCRVTMLYTSGFIACVSLQEGAETPASSSASQKQDDGLATMAEFVAIKCILLMIPTTTGPLVKCHGYVPTILAFHA
jgi:hypothetical protein